MFFEGQFCFWKLGISRPPSPVQYSDAAMGCKIGSGSGKMVERGQTGSKLYLQIIEHQNSSATEIIISSPKFNFWRWIALTISFNLIGYIMNMHLQDSRLLSSIIVLLSCALLWKLHHKIKQESLLVIASLGIQLTTQFATGRQTAQFYDMNSVKDVVINEGISLQRVWSYLTLILKDNSVHGMKLVPLFTNTWPSLSCLIKIYQSVQQVLENS